MTATLQLLREMKLDGMRLALQSLQDMGDSSLESLWPILGRLVEAEAEQRRQTKAERLARQAKFRYAASLQTVATGVERNLDKSLLTRLADGRWIAAGRNLLITGPTGAGKSYLASALGRHACLQGYRTRYFNCGRLWAHLRQARNRDRYEKELRALSKVDVLILDDFGLSKLDAPDRLSFLEILEDRWGKTSTVVVAQRPFDTWHEILGEPTVADAICDRLFSNAEKIELKGESLRKTPRIIDSNLPPH
ncbi:MAG: ATP-binding protein [Spirochaetales bacterium]|nr:MAG: ATP-binding protein [Spirochaetales bacterium]